MPSKNEVTIVILGATGSGKSTIAEIIGKALEGLGLPVTLKDEDEQKPATYDEHINRSARRLIALQNRKTEVTVRMLHTVPDAILRKLEEQDGLNPPPQT